MNSIKRKAKAHLIFCAVLAFIFFFIVTFTSAVETSFQNEVIALAGTDEVQGLIADSGYKETSGKATYIGVNDKDTAFSKAILLQTRKWSEQRSPLNNGYRGYCEAWVADTFHDAGYPYKACCCAYRHSTYAKKTGKLPKGAAIFSGRKPDGTMYENGHRASAYCDVCHHWAGHVAIYVGNGLVVGSQYPYMMALDSWIDLYGYGGYITG